MRKYLLHLLIISFVFIFIPNILASEEGKDRLLVVLLKAKKGIEQDEATLLTDILSVEIYRSGMFTILNRDDMKAVLTEKEFEIAMGCDDNVCLLENVAKLAAKKIIAGNIGKLGRKYIVSIRLINEDGHNEVMEKEICDCTIEELDKSIENITYKLLKYLGAEITTYSSIMVESEPSRAKIYVDGSHLGTTPDIIRYIEPGSHKVEVLMDGYKEWSKKVDVGRGEEKILIAILQKKTTHIKRNDNTVSVDQSVYSDRFSRTYHMYNCPKLNTEALIKFDSSQEANDAGAFPCKLCNPSQQVPVRVADRQPITKTSAPSFQNSFLRVTLQSISKSVDKKRVNLVFTLENISNEDIWLALEGYELASLVGNQGAKWYLDEFNGINKVLSTSRVDKKYYSVFNPWAKNTIVMVFESREASEGTVFSFSANMYRFVNKSPTRFSIGISDMRITQ